MGFHSRIALDRGRLPVFSTSMLATSLAAASLLMTPAPVAAGSLTCDYNPSNHRVTVTMTGDYGTRIQRTRLGRITVAGSWCDGARVNNTDLIDVTGDGGNQTLNLSILRGGFTPGWTNEPGNFDEIEFSVAFAGGFDRLVVEGTDDRDDIELGRLPTPFGTFGIINLNGAEFAQSIMDADVLLSGVNELGVFGYLGPDSIDANAYYSSFDKSLHLPVHIFGGKGNDHLTGGEANDRIYAGLGNDWVSGWDGDDLNDVRDGVLGNDEAHDGYGDNTCLFDQGDNVTCS